MFINILLISSVLVLSTAIQIKVGPQTFSDQQSSLQPQKPEKRYINNQEIKYYIPVDINNAQNVKGASEQLSQPRFERPLLPFIKISPSGELQFQNVEQIQSPSVQNEKPKNDNSQEGLEFLKSFLEQNPGEQYQFVKYEQGNQEEQRANSFVQYSNKEQEENNLSERIQQQLKRILESNRVHLKAFSSDSEENNFRKVIESEQVVKQSNNQREQENDSVRKEIENILRARANSGVEKQIQEEEESNYQKSPFFIHRLVRVTKHHPVNIVKQVKVPVPTPVLVPVPEPYEVKVPQPYHVPVEVIRHIPIPIVICFIALFAPGLAKPKPQDFGKRYLSQELNLYLTPEEVKSLQAIKASQNARFANDNAKQVQINESNEGLQKYFDPQIQSVPSDGPQVKNFVPRGVLLQQEKNLNENLKNKNVAYIYLVKEKDQSNLSSQQSQNIEQVSDKQENQIKINSNAAPYVPVSYKNQEEKLLHEQLVQHWNRLLEHNRAQLQSLSLAQKEPRGVESEKQIIKSDQQEIPINQDQKVIKIEDQEKINAEDEKTEVEKEIESILRNHQDFNSKKFNPRGSQNPPILIHRQVSITKHHPIPVYKQVKVQVPTPVLVPVPEPYAVRVPQPYPVPLEVVKHIPVPVIKNHY
ncbi:hypothetical protein KGM_211350 [Danaus plexippus plexippus]|uniref:Uncharacterized protein n=1 Tax=Danaus plexippus plexippus TaxID=278856 RepID=A0A212EMY8_DANPL|nr:hypothetical protein KGM_211350 [Danaus plexippus plexippus]